MMARNRFYSLLIGLLLFHGASSARACIWDSDTLLQERFTSPRLAAAVLEAPQRPEVGRLRARIKALRTAPRETDPAWWSDLAGAHLRLGEPQAAVSILEPAVKRFPDDYGVHANLGTAYHPLNRYPEAEREIARDLELNPEAHFGLERYHLALLQYLIRDPAYRARHVYVDEWTIPFLTGEAPWPGNSLGLLPLPALNGYDHELAERLTRGRRSRAAARGQLSGDREAREQVRELLQAMRDRSPGYRYRWDLARDPKFAAGVIYLASLNREEPACWVMLGIACLHNSDLNLAKTAFRRAVDLGIPQAPVLKRHIEAIRWHQLQAAPFGIFNIGAMLALGALTLFLLQRIFRRKVGDVVRRHAGNDAAT